MSGIQTPEWTAFDVWFYPGKVFGDLSGFTDRNAQHQGSLADVFRVLCTQARIANFTDHLFVQPGAWAYGGMRRLLQLFGIHVHCEVVSGLSYRRMASLDVFVATHTRSMGIEPQPMALWNASYEDKNGIGHFPSQDHWWYLPVWRSFGPSEYGNNMDYKVDFGIQAHVEGFLQGLAPLARTGDAVARARIGHILGHLGPQVFLPGPQLAVLRPMLPLRDRRMPEEDEHRNARF